MEVYEHIDKDKLLAIKDLLVTETKPKGILISIEGMQKCGKTEFGLSMPGNLFILNLNFGLAGVIEKHVANGKSIYVQDIQLPLSKDLPGQAFTILSTAAAEQWRKAILSLQEALKADDIPNIFIDTASELWELLRVARLGKLAQVIPVQYAVVNAEFRQLLQLLMCSKKNIVLSHKLRPEYVNDQKTNRFERSGFGDVGFDVQVSLQASRDLKREGDDQCTLTFLDSRANKNLRGEILTGKNATFLNVVKMVYPETTDADWS